MDNGNHRNCAWNLCDISSSEIYLHTLVNESNIIIPGQHDPKYNKDVEAARQAAMEHDPPKPVAAMLMDNGSMIVLSQYGQQMPVLQCNLFELWGHIVEAAGYGKDVDVAVTCKQEKVRKITGVGQDFKIEMDAVDSTE